jgi:hypothetical protein
MDTYDLLISLQEENSMLKKFAHSLGLDINKLLVFMMSDANNFWRENMLNHLKIEFDIEKAIANGFGDKATSALNECFINLQAKRCENV